MSLVKYFFACVVFSACSVVAAIDTAVDAVARCSTVLHEGNVRLFIQLHYQSELKTPKDQPIKRRRAPSKRLRYAETKLLQILRRYTVLDIPRGDFGIQFQWPLMALETIKGQIFP